MKESLLLLTLLLIGKIAKADNVRFVINQPWDYRKITDLIQGPHGHFYALSEDKRLALIKLDSNKVDGIRNYFLTVKNTVNFGAWTGAENSYSKFSFLGTSQDGKLVAISMVSYGLSKDRTLQQIRSGSSINAFIFDMDQEKILLTFSEKTGVVQQVNFENSKIEIFARYRKTMRVLKYNLQARRYASDSSFKWNPNGVDYRQQYLSPFKISSQYNQVGSSVSFKELTFTHIRDTIKVWRKGSVLLVRPSQDYYALSADGDYIGLKSEGGKKPLMLLISKRSGAILDFTLTGAQIVIHVSGHLFFGTGPNGYFLSDGTKPVVESRFLPAESNKLACTRYQPIFLWIKGLAGLRFDLRRRRFSAHPTFNGEYEWIFPVHQTPKMGFNLVPGQNGGLYCNGRKIDGFRDNLDLIDVALGENFAIDAWGKEIRRYDQKGRLKWKSLHDKKIVAQKILGRDRTVVLASDENEILFINSEKGNPYLSLFVDTSTMDWACWTPSGYYDCSLGGERLISRAVKRSNDSLPGLTRVARYKDKFYRPDIIDSILKYENENEGLKRAPLINAKYQNHQKPKIKLVSPGMNDFFSDSLLTVRYELDQGSEAVHTIQVLINGVLVKEVKYEQGSSSLEVVAPPKNCSISLLALSAAGQSDVDFCRLIWNGFVDPNVNPIAADLYVLAVGVSNYKSKDLQLKFAAKDAEDFSDIWCNQTSLGLYKNLYYQVLTNTEANRANIEEALEQLGKKVTSHDVCMIFLSGHGQNDSKGKFYYLPWEGDRDHLLSTGVQGATFKETVSSIQGKVLIFADACYSGNLLDGMRKKTGKVEDLIEEMAKANPGIIVFASSTAGKVSVENPVWNNGAFTKAVIEGISGKADQDSSGHITVAGLNYYIARRVRELTKGYQMPTTIMPEGISDYPIAISPNTKVEK